MKPFTHPVVVPVELPELPLGDPLLDGEVRVFVAEEVRQVDSRARHLVGQLVQEMLLEVPFPRLRTFLPLANQIRHCSDRPQ